MYRNCNGEEVTLVSTSAQENQNEAEMDVQSENQNESEMDDVDYPYLASNPFPPIPESQVMDFVDPVNSALKDPFKKALEEADIQLGKESSTANWIRNQAPRWTSPLVPSHVYCLDNRFDNATTALTSLLFHVDLALEDYPNRHPSTEKHKDLYRQLNQQVLKLRQLDKQFLKTKKEIRRILDLDYYDHAFKQQ